MSDFAIIETGGKQYKITPNCTIDIEKLDAKEGDIVSFDKVLLLSEGDNVQVGNPYLKDFKLEAKVTSQKKAPKIDVIRFKAKSRYRRKNGHRQNITSVTFSNLSVKAKETVKKTK